MPGDMFGTDAEQAEKPCFCAMAGKQTEVRQKPRARASLGFSARSIHPSARPQVDTWLPQGDHLASLVGLDARTESMLFWRHISGYNMGEGL